MEYNRFEEEARVNSMILEKANGTAEDAYYAAEDAVVKGYKAIERGVTGAYKKVENAFVSGWGKVEDACVNVIFKKEGETTAQAKERLGKKSDMQPEGTQA